MSRRPFVMLLPVLLSMSFIPSGGAAQVAPIVPVAANTIDRDARADVVAKLSDALRNNYVFPDVGEKAAQKITASLAAGEYANLNDANAFAARLSSDVAAVAHDKHLWVFSESAPPPPPRGAAGDIPHAEAGLTRADKLAGGIGYIEVIGFPPLPMFKPTVDRALSALKGSRALIIDDRRNGGGSPDAVAYLVSFLVSRKQTVEINDIVSRTAKTNNFTRKRFDSQPTPVSFAGIPVYVLTGKNTSSGGEEFAYDVQTHKFGKIVGEITGGGANPTGPVELGHGIVAMIPFGRADNPITRTNWEGRGVQPDISVPAQDALKVALQRLGGKPASAVTAASLKQVFTPRSTPLGGSETAVRELVAGLVSGKPDYANMSPEQANATREQLPQLQHLLLPLGELRSTKFRQVGMMGADQYEVSFDRGTLTVAVLVDSNGKILAAMFLRTPAVP